MLTEILSNSEVIAIIGAFFGAFFLGGIAATRLINSLSTDIREYVHNKVEVSQKEAEIARSVEIRKSSKIHDDLTIQILSLKTEVREVQAKVRSYKEKQRMDNLQKAPLIGPLLALLKDEAFVRMLVAPFVAWLISLIPVLTPYQEFIIYAFVVVAGINSIRDFSPTVGKFLVANAATVGKLSADVIDYGAKRILKFDLPDSIEDDVAKLIEDAINIEAPSGLLFKANRVKRE